MNNLIENLNFKKIIIIYLILLIITISTIFIFFSRLYHDKISILYNYHQLSEVFEENYNQDKVKKQITRLSNSSKDIIDVVILKDNQITYTTNNFYQNKLTNLYNTNNYYQDDQANVYKLDNKKEFLLALFDLKAANKNDYYNKFQLNTPKDNQYTINYLENTYTNEKVIIVSQISSLKNSKKYFKIALSFLILFFMLYWIIIALMIYQNALKMQTNAYLWGLLTLFTNLLGAILYLIFIKDRTICSKCHHNIAKSDHFCKSCGEKC